MVLFAISNVSRVRIPHSYMNALGNILNGCNGRFDGRGQPAMETGGFLEELASL
jgi:hypothetical protein